MDASLFVTQMPPTCTEGHQARLVNAPSRYTCSCLSLASACKLHEGSTCPCYLIQGTGQAPILVRAPRLVFVLLGCCDKTPQTGWLTNNGNISLTVLGAGSSRLRCRMVRQGEGRLLNQRLLAVSSYGKRGQGALSFCGGTNPIHEGSTFVT